jgi:hypothetical protein
MGYSAVNPVFSWITSKQIPADYNVWYISLLRKYSFKGRKKFEDAFVRQMKD